MKYKDVKDTEIFKEIIKTEPLQECHDCGVEPGKDHSCGCDVERCRLCGGQMISCNCVYFVNKMKPSELENKYPEIYYNGATDEMWQKYDDEVEKFGGRLEWLGIWPGRYECYEFNYYVEMIPDSLLFGPVCDRNHPNAFPNLNRLSVCNGAIEWDKKLGRWVKRIKE